MTNVEFHLQLNHNDTWNMSRLHFHDHFELLLPLTSPGNIFVNDQVYPLRRGTLYLIGENTLHRTMATGAHARYVLHISRKSLMQLSTVQTDFTQLTHDSFRRANLNGMQTGELSGFSDNSHFIRTFGHLTGVTPGRYAKEYQSSDQILLRENLKHR